jgi:hypothetical protein
MVDNTIVRLLMPAAELMRIRDDITASLPCPPADDETIRSTFDAAVLTIRLPGGSNGSSPQASSDCCQVRGNRSRRSGKDVASASMAQYRCGTSTLRSRTIRSS